MVDIGPGEFPSKIATDFFDITNEFEKNLGGRPLKIGNAENLPFTDKEFDYVIASHIAEHTDNPDLVISEAQRVGKRGYIECPHIIIDWIMQHGDAHGKWQVTLSGNTFVFVALAPEYKKYLTDSMMHEAGWIMTQSNNKLSQCEKAVRRMFWDGIPFLNPFAHWDETTGIKVIVVR